jgi:hypothetical protein
VRVWCQDLPVAGGRGGFCEFSVFWKRERDLGGGRSGSLPFFRRPLGGWVVVVGVVEVGRPDVGGAVAVVTVDMIAMGSIPRLDPPLSSRCAKSELCEWDG